MKCQPPGGTTHVWPPLGEHVGHLYVPHQNSSTARLAALLTSQHCPLLAGKNSFGTFWVTSAGGAEEAACERQVSVRGDRNALVLP